MVARRRRYGFIRYARQHGTKRLWLVRLMGRRPTKVQISGYVANANMQAVSVLGRIVNVGRLGGMKGEFDFDLHAMKRIDYIGVTFRTRSTEEVRKINRLMRADLLPAVESGELRLPIDKTYPFVEADAAFAHMRANAHFGKIVLSH
jgi:NADPH:quinone reductase